MRRPWPLPILWAAAGLFWFLWLGYEDRNTVVVLALAALIGAVLLATYWHHRLTARKGLKRLLVAAAAGVVLGAGVPLLAALLILLKLSLHSHPIPDFTLGDVQQLLRVVPVWSVVGLLSGAALGLTQPLGDAADVASPHGVAYNNLDDKSGETRGNDGSG